MKDEIAMPAWLQTYQDGVKQGPAQAFAAYADYYGMSGDADNDPFQEERLGYMPPPMVAYASRTGTRRNLAAMREAGWRLLVSAAGVLRTEGFRYALDNGAWSAFQQGVPFDERAFGRAVDLLGENADWVVLPDIVAGGMKSLEFSVRWLERLGKCFPQRLLIAVQDGMEPDEVRESLSPSVGIFLGGSTEWKLQTMAAWGVLARRRNCYYHVGRVNSARRIAMCAGASVNSFDGTSVTRYANTLPRLDAALCYSDGQGDLFSLARETVASTPYDCGWPIPLKTIGRCRRGAAA